MDKSNLTESDYIYDYNKAFSRNIGWVTDLEQHLLKNKRIAIAGLGGVGGFHFLTLARLGIQNFNIADLDHFEIHNFNRQAGAMVSTLGKNKAEALSGMAKDINPDINIKLFSDGVNAANLDAFLKDVDLYVDGLDFFVPDVRSMVYKRCHELSIPILNAGPIGMSVIYIIFMPGKMTFEEYFCFEGCNDIEKRINFFIGVSPKMHAMKYLMDPLAINFEEKRGPSTVMACELCAGVVGTNAVKILLNRGHIYPAPYFHYYDAYYDKYYRGKLRWGNRGPLQRLKRYIALKTIAIPKPKKYPVYSVENTNNEIMKIIDLSRWAPSGDNSQPWSFELLDGNSVRIHICHDEKREGAKAIFDYGDMARLMSIGMLIETIRIAASQYQRQCLIKSINIIENSNYIDIDLSKSNDIKFNLLSEYIPYRSVNRHCYQTTCISDKDKMKLSDAIGSDIKITWFDSNADKRKMAGINARMMNVRLHIPELYSIHKEIIDIKYFSEDAVPADALGLTWLTKKLMLWAMSNEKRYNILMKYFGAGFFTAVETDWLPSIFCGAHFVLTLQDNSKLDDPATLVKMGEAVQRFWLTATSLGLVLHPNYAHVLFSNFSNNNVKFTNDEKLIDKVHDITDKLNCLFDTKKIILAGRIGFPRKPEAGSRSVRKSLEKLLIRK